MSTKGKGTMINQVRYCLVCKSSWVETEGGGLRDSYHYKVDTRYEITVHSVDQVDRAFFCSTQCIHKKLFGGDQSTVVFEDNPQRTPEDTAGKVDKIAALVEIIAQRFGVELSK